MCWASKAAAPRPQTAAARAHRGQLVHPSLHVRVPRSLNWARDAQRCCYSQCVSQAGSIPQCNSALSAPSRRGKRTRAQGSLADAQRPRAGEGLDPRRGGSAPAVIEHCVSARKPASCPFSCCLGRNKTGAIAARCCDQEAYGQGRPPCLAVLRFQRDTHPLWWEKTGSDFPLRRGYVSVFP